MYQGILQHDECLEDGRLEGLELAGDAVGIALEERLRRDDAQRARNEADDEDTRGGRVARALARHACDEERRRCVVGGRVDARESRRGAETHDHERGWLRKFTEYVVTPIIYALSQYSATLHTHNYI